MELMFSCWKLNIQENKTWRRMQIVLSSGMKTAHCTRLGWVRLWAKQWGLSGEADLMVTESLSREVTLELSLTQMSKRCKPCKDLGEGCSGHSTMQRPYDEIKLRVSQKQNPLDNPQRWTAIVQKSENWGWRGNKASTPIAPAHLQALQRAVSLGRNLGSDRTELREPGHGTSNGFLGVGVSSNHDFFQVGKLLV